MAMSVVFWLLVSAVLVTGEECNVGEVTFTGFDPLKYQGTWYEHYRIPNDDEVDFNDCEFDRYFATANGVSVMSVAYNLTKKGFEISTGHIAAHTENSFTISYNNDAAWSNEYWVLGTDYETYSVVTGCVNEENTTPLIWVASHSKDDMSQDTIAKVNDILKAHDLTIEDDFEKVSQEKCGDI